MDEITTEQALALRASLNDVLAMLLSGDPACRDFSCVRVAYALLKSTPGPITVAFERLNIPPP